MPVDTPLDLTPPFTISTVQFSSSLLNTVVNSLVTVLILANINSIVSKVIYFSRGKKFSYSSWLRAYIYANSDDPFRIISWISHNYRYRKRKYNRYHNVLKWRRLVRPLLARAIVLIISIVSIGITIPSDKKITGCLNGDFRAVLGEVTSDARDMVPACLDVPIRSDRGKVNMQVLYCKCVVIPIGSQRNGIYVRHYPEDGSIEVIVSLNDGDDQFGYRSHIEWKRTDLLDGPVYRSQLSSSINIDQHTDVAIDATEDLLEQRGCSLKLRTNSELMRNVSLENCQTNTLNSSHVALLTTRIESRTRDAITWQRTSGVEGRILISDRDEPEEFNECPMVVTISRPIVNMVPLILTLVGWAIMNLLVSWGVSAHGNALDSGFHLVKEALGHDTTSNPLQENVERDERMELPLRLWRCGPASAHVGFLGRAGDIPIEDFTKELVVCGCNRVNQEIEESEKMDASMSSRTTGTATQYNSHSTFQRPP